MAGATPATSQRPGDDGRRQVRPGGKTRRRGPGCRTALRPGKIVVFGDTSGLTNGLTIGCHAYTSRLLAYLADGERPPRTAGGNSSAHCWLSAVVAAAIAGPRPWLLAGWRAPRPHAEALRWHPPGAGLLPDGNCQTPNNLAYIDASHLEAYSRESLRADGRHGPGMNLMRNGYLTLMLPELTTERLAARRLLVSVAPCGNSRRRSEDIKDFVRSGGVFVSTVGHDRPAPAEAAGRVGIPRRGRPRAAGEKPGGPTPLGHFKSPYFDGGDYSGLRAVPRRLAGLERHLEEPKEPRPRQSRTIARNSR